MGDAGKIPMVASAVASAVDPVADATAISAVTLAIPEGQKKDTHLICGMESALNYQTNKMNH